MLAEGLMSTGCQVTPGPYPQCLMVWHDQLKTPELTADKSSSDLWWWHNSGGITNASNLLVKEMMQDRRIDVADSLSLAAS